jgi:hypothetical protein
MWCFRLKLIQYFLVVPKEKLHNSLVSYSSQCGKLIASLHDDITQKRIILTRGGPLEIYAPVP